MFKKIKILAIIFAVIAFIAGSLSTEAAISEKAKNDKRLQQDKTQRAAFGLFDLQENTVSNIEFYVTNYGIFGFNTAAGGGIGGGYWPRGSLNQYIFGGGVWFGALKKFNQDTVPLVLVTYNPNSGLSWTVPGRINAGGPTSTLNEDTWDVDVNDTKTYRSYFSTDFNLSSGSALNTDDGPAWPIWDFSSNPFDTLKVNRYFGQYVDNPVERSRDYHSKGPAFISEEDIFATYKDTDLNYYEGGNAQRRSEGYPLQLQFEEMIYSWGFGRYKDFIFIKYEITNYSPDTLFKCWLAPVLDVDLARAPNTRLGASNDRTTFYFQDSSLNLAYQWTNSDLGESNVGFGYLGFDFLESPATFQAYDEDGLPTFDPENGYVRKDKKFFEGSEQLGLVSMRNWNIQDDPKENAERYAFISEPILDGDNGPGDKRFMMSTGPFNMRPADTVRVVVGIMLANTAKGRDADGTPEDVAELISLNKFAQAVYDNNFRAPTPPNRTNFISWKPLNNAIEVKWDDQSERSNDVDEKGLDFLGYRLYRARRTDLDTFNTNNISGGGDYPLGQGPFGWKQIASWELPTPYTKSTRRIINEPNNQKYSFIDSLVIVGPYTDDNTGAIIDSFAIRAWRVPRGAFVGDNRYLFTQIDPPLNSARPILRSVDSSYFSRPWGKYFTKLMLESGLDPSADYFYEDIKNTAFHDQALETIIYLNKSLFKYNPLLMRPILTEVNKDYLLEKIKVKVFSDGIVGDTIHFEKRDSLGALISIDTLRTSIDTVYFVNTMRREYIDGYKWLVEALIPQEQNAIMFDTTGYVRSVLDSVYKYIQAGNLIERVEMYDFVEEDPYVKNNVILPFMKEVTNDRSFLDIGDDNRNQLLELSDDPDRTEKLINNMDYYYRILAYDEGDWTSGTERKINTGILKSDSYNDTDYFNIVKTSPRASNIGDESQFEIIHVDSSLIGGLYNFNFFSLDPQRLNQDFAGHELELEFNPYWDATTLALSSDPNATPLTFGIYRSYVTLTDVTSGDLLFEDLLWYEPQACNYSYTQLFSENGASVVFTYPADERIDTISFPPDTITFHKYNNTEMVTRSGEFTTGDFTQQGYCYSSSVLPPAYGTVGFGFNFTLQQYGGAHRQSAQISTFKDPSEDAVTPIRIVNSNFIGGSYAANSLPDFASTRLTQYVGVDWELRRPVMGSFNNGPGEYLVEFLPGGEETVTLEFTDGRTNEFVVPYLNIRVTNSKEYLRPDPGGDSVVVDYNNEMEHIAISPTNASISFEDELMAFNPIIGNGIYGQIYPDPINLAFENDSPSTENNLWIPKTIGMSNLGRKEYKVATNKFIGKYNMSAYGFGNIREINFPFQFANKYVVDVNSPYKNLQTSFSGLPQGRYYLTARSRDGQDIVDFANVINIGGLNYVFNYANAFHLNWKVTNNSGSVTENRPSLDREQNYTYGADFAAGDQVTLKSIGGASGLPLPGAKVRVRVTEHTPETITYSDEQLDDILVVPNPYYVSHQGEKSPYDSKLYFTKLPPRCTISIYTLTGDLLKVIEHDEMTASQPGRAYTEVWNLLTDNNQRTQSQALVAHIKTPDGAETIKPFSIIVGGFRIITD